eukprot:jgi/Bigna1/60122/fgenesh1_kg.9_\
MAAGNGEEEVFGGDDVCESGEMVAGNYEEEVFGGDQDSDGDEDNIVAGNNEEEVFGCEEDDNDDDDEGQPGTSSSNIMAALASIKNPNQQQCVENTERKVEGNAGVANKTCHRADCGDNSLPSSSKMITTEQVTRTATAIKSHCAKYSPIIVPFIRFLPFLVYIAWCFSDVIPAPESNDNNFY